MWLFTKQGFCSVVEDRDDENMVWVRFRCKEDFGAMLEEIGMDNIVLATESFNRDYRYRIKTTKKRFVEFARRQAERIDYHNFKDAVHGDPTRDEAYMDVWRAMSRFQYEKGIEKENDDAEVH